MTKAHYHGVAGVLPEEMLVEVLVRIPARYALDLRRVSKSWDGLIMNPQFASKHLDRNRNNPEHNSILLICFCQRLTRKSLSLFRLNQKPHTLVDVSAFAGRQRCFLQNLNFPDFFKDLVVAGSFNGILCVSSHSQAMITNFLALWNPAINYWKPIVPLPYKNSDSFYSTVGLAFDSLTNDYRIIRLVSSVARYSPPSARVEIYSANQDSWLDLPDNAAPIPYFTTQPNCSVIVKGVPYWSRNYTDFVDPTYTPLQTNVIATIDPHTALYTQIPYPHIVTNANTTTVHPFNFMDSLAVLIYSPPADDNSNPPEKMFHVYRLLDDDKSRRATDWIHLYTYAPTILQNTNMCIIRCFQDAGKIIVVGWNYDNRRRSFLYDLQTDCLCHSIGMDAFRPRWDETYCHVESLVCLDGMEPIQREEDSNNNVICGLNYLGRPLGPLL